MFSYYLFLDDFDAMLERARNAGLKSMIITGTSLKESREAVTLAQELGTPFNHIAEFCSFAFEGFFCTIGCHPTRAAEFDKFKDGPDAYLLALDKLVASNLHGKGRVVAIGECGLDYDRLHFATPEVQQRHFRSQLSLAKKYHLPLFLHSRAAHADFVKILCEEGFGEDGGNAVGGKGGVVHSFTGSPQEATELVSTSDHRNSCFTNSLSDGHGLLHQVRLGVHIRKPSVKHSFIQRQRVFP
jgi:TatD DNase family protein